MALSWFPSNTRAHLFIALERTWRNCIWQHILVPPLLPFSIRGKLDCRHTVIKPSCSVGLLGVCENFGSKVNLKNRLYVTRYLSRLVGWYYFLFEKEMLKMQGVVGTEWWLHLRNLCSSKIRSLLHSVILPITPKCHGACASAEPSLQCSWPPHCQWNDSDTRLGSTWKWPTGLVMLLKTGTWDPHRHKCPHRFWSASSAGCGTWAIWQTFVKCKSATGILGVWGFRDICLVGRWHEEAAWEY